MPTTEAKSSVPPTQTCPLCDTPLDPNNPTECPKCDWHIGYRGQPEESKGSPRDFAAVVMSVIPGLGHIYKGHKLTGALLMAGALIIIGMSVVFATSTVLASLLMLPTYWIGVMLHVYWAEDIAAAKMPKPHKQM